MLLPMLAINEYDPCTVQMNYCIAKVTFTSKPCKKTVFLYDAFGVKL
jgi:hypothetical protein